MSLETTLKLKEKYNDLTALWDILSALGNRAERELTISPETFHLLTDIVDDVKVAIGEIVNV